MNQVERIFRSNAPAFSIGNTIYKGRPPVYNIDRYGQVTKIAKGIPFIKVRRA